MTKTKKIRRYISYKQKRFNYLIKLLFIDFLNLLRIYAKFSNYNALKNTFVLIEQRETSITLYIKKVTALVVYLKINNYLILYIKKVTSVIVVEQNTEKFMIMYFKKATAMVLFSKKTADFILIDYDKTLLNIHTKIIKPRNITKKYKFYLDPQFRYNIQIKPLDNFKCYEVITNMDVPHDFENYFPYYNSYHPTFISFMFQIFMNKNIATRASLYLLMSNNVKIPLFAYTEYHRCIHQYPLRKALIYALRMYSRCVLDEDTEYFKADAPVRFILKFEIIIK